MSRNSSDARSYPSTAAILLAASVLAEPAAAQGTTGPYDELTNTYRSVTNFNVETVRGLHVAASGRVLMLNTHGSTLNAYIPGGPLEPDFYWPTLNNPIALDVYVDDSVDPATEYAVVLGGGTHAVALHDLATGRIVATLQLDAETGDLVVDQANHRGYASIPGNNTVVQFGLPSLTVQAIHTVASQRPRFLSFGPGSDAADENVLTVTPELSGNNTISQNAVNDPALPPPGFPALASAAFPLDLTPFLPDGLPDEDLFEITPYTGGGPPPTVKAVPVLRNAGTLLFAHGRNPVSGAYWILNVDSRNTAAFNEPALNGDFARNRLTIAPTTGGSPLPWQNTAIDLDLVGASYNSLFSISLPYALTFHPSGSAVIAGSASDQIRALDSVGARIGDIELPPGSIPRGMAFDAQGLILFVYCWGTNEVRIYDVAALLNAMAADPNQIVAYPQPPLVQAGYIASFALGADPNPDEVKDGREIFYDGDNSAQGRMTCGHCHPGGGMDLLGWNIQDFPHDHKDLMVTQSLKSIEDTFPYHWRGERDLEAFNVAFAGLLGGTKLDESPGGELDLFKAFVFNLQAHANPRQNRLRVLDSALSTTQEAYFPEAGHGPGDPVNGQVLMDLPNTLFGRFSCADCHGKPAGTVGDPQNDDVGTIPTNLTMDVAHFRQLTPKAQDLVTFTAAGATFRGPRGGFGLSHDGDHPSIFDFLDRNPFAVTTPQKRDLAAFVEQADEGITPAAHLAWTVDGSTSSATFQEISNVLLSQAGPTFTAAHWVSVAVIGTHRDAQGVDHDLRWYYLPSPGAFFASDPTVVFPNGSTGSQTWNDLVAEARAGRARFTILGLPPGNALRFAADRDDDLLSDFDEGALGTDPFDPDFDGDGDWDGHEVANGGDPLLGSVGSNDVTDPALISARVDHMGASYGKFVFTFSEPVRVNITATNVVTGHVTTETRYAHRAWETITVQRLEPSLPAVTFPAGYPIPNVAGLPYFYRFDIQMTDLGGRTATVSTGAFANPRDQLVLLPFDIAQQGGVAGMPPALLSRTIENLSWVGTPGVGPAFQATATAAVRFDVPELQQAYTNPPLTPNQSANPHEKQVVVAQVLYFDSTTGTWSVVPSSGPGLSVSAPAGRLQNQVVVRGDPTPQVPNPQAIGLGVLPGPYLLSTPSDASGNVTFNFTLSQAVLPGDRVKLNVIAILEQDVRDNPPANEFWLLSMFSYNMPVTAEADRGISTP